MIAPGKVLQKLIDDVISDKEALGIVDAAPGAEDLTGDALTAPYIIIYISFDKSAQIMAYGTPSQIPVDIKAVVVSTEHETVWDSFDEAFRIAARLIRKIPDEYVLQNFDGDDELMRIDCDEQVITVLGVSAKITTLQCNFNYLIPLIHNF